MSNRNSTAQRRKPGKAYDETGNEMAQEIILVRKEQGSPTILALIVSCVGYLGVMQIAILGGAWDVNGDELDAGAKVLSIVCVAIIFVCIRIWKEQFTPPKR